MDNNNIVENVVGTTGGIAWKSGSLMGSTNPNVPSNGYRYSTISKRYKYDINDPKYNTGSSTGAGSRELPNHVQIQFRHRSTSMNDNNDITITNDNTETTDTDMTDTYDIPISSTTQDLQLLLNECIKQSTADDDTNNNSNTKMIPYAFYIKYKEQEQSDGTTSTTNGAIITKEIEITNNVHDLLQLYPTISTESIIQITYQPLSIYTVRPVSRCTNTLNGHVNAILHVSFAAHGKLLASGGGDCIIRFWDTNTSTTKYIGHTIDSSSNTTAGTTKGGTKAKSSINSTTGTGGHKDHILCTSWSSDSQRFVSGDKSGRIIVWDPNSGLLLYSKQAHTKYITSIAWEPLHLCNIPKDGENQSSAVDVNEVHDTNNNTKMKKQTYNDLVICKRFVTASKDTTIKLWNMDGGKLLCETTLSGHTDCVECVKWSGNNYIVSCSRDRTIKVWNVNRGILIRTLVGHGHRINTIAISSDYIVRCGPYDYQHKSFTNKHEMLQVAKDKYTTYRQNYGNPYDTLVSGSDDYTLYIWNYETSKQPIKRLTGHQQLINHIVYSPDGRYIASASFDKKIKIWDGMNGNYLITLSGHVGPVYQVVWSYDSRYIVSGSKDSTVKLWDISSRTKDGKMISTAKETLPGHADEVYTIDWSPISGAVATGSKDRTIKIWKH